MFRCARVLFSELLQRVLCQRRGDCDDERKVRTNNQRPLYYVGLSRGLLGECSVLRRPQMFRSTRLHHRNPGHRDAQHPTVSQGHAFLPGVGLRLSER